MDNGATSTVWLFRNARIPNNDQWLGMAKPQKDLYIPFFWLFPRLKDEESPPKKTKKQLWWPSLHKAVN